jgi:hypothetical protein
MADGEEDLFMSLRRLCVLSVGFVSVVVVLSSAPAQAQVTPGIRGGISVDPDQFYFGGHIETAALVDRLHFRPNIEVGFGDNVTLVAFNFEFVYRFASRRPWHVYAVGGPAVNLLVRDGGDDTDAGFNIGFGAQNRQGLFFEFKVGASSSPDLKFGVGYAFR